MTSVLMVLSAADHWTLSDGSKHPSGVWAEEFAVPYEIRQLLEVVRPGVSEQAPPGRW